MAHLDSLDPDRLITAAHELAHLLIFRQAGIECSQIRVYGHGGFARGRVSLVPGQKLNTAQQRGLLVGTLAGREADLRWCDEHGIRRHPERTCAQDRQLYHSDRRRMQFDSASHSALCAETRRLVNKHWSRIQHLAPLLAERGRISVSR